MTVIILIEGLFMFILRMFKILLLIPFVTFITLLACEEPRSTPSMTNQDSAMQGSTLDMNTVSTQDQFTSQSDMNTTDSTVNQDIDLPDMQMDMAIDMQWTFDLSVDEEAYNNVLSY